MTSAATREHLESIGARIREARRARRMTLEALAGGVGLSVTFLSRLERGQVACSIGNLLEIAGFLGLSAAALMDDAGRDGRPAAYRVVRAADGAEATAGADGAAGGWRRLASGRAEQRLEAFCLDLPDAASAPPLVTHPGEEFCFVLEGDVRFRVGEDEIPLGPGDSIHLRSDVPHMAWRADSRPARLLMVTAIDNLSATAVEWWAQARLPAAAPPPSPTPAEETRE